ncbi:hypothetical protein BBP40_005081 [Aspergillus hancockii]|nr:hypothetical protein BBP40_005081 [Aspergillus hancockii]
MDDIEPSGLPQIPNSWPPIRAPIIRNEDLDSGDNSSESTDDGEEFNPLQARRITRQLNISKSYVRGWKSTDAFREFYQNWKDAIIESFNSHEAFRPQFKENDQFMTVTVSASGGPNPQGYMGFILFNKKTGRITIANASAQLQPKHLQLGRTSKDNREELAGCHGEGFKIAAMVMMRAGYKIRMEASNYNWNFRFKGPTKSQLACTMNPSNRTPTSQNSKAMPELKSRIWRDVAVTIGPGSGDQRRKVERNEFLEWLGISLNIEGLSTPSDVVETVHGDLILDPHYKNKIYLKGLLLPQSASSIYAFQYGYNFHYGHVNRDRERLVSRDQEARILRDIWEAAIAPENENDVLPKYVEMLRNKSQCPDVYQASELVRPPMAAKIWKYLLSEAGEERFYYCDKQDKDVEVIKESLRKEPIGLPEALWDILRRASLIRTPEEERIEQFRGAQESSTAETAFSKTIQRVLKASLMLDQCTDQTKIMFVDCEHSDIEIYFESDINLLKIHRKWLEFHAIHTDHPCCVSSAMDSGIVAESFFCDHIFDMLYLNSIREIVEDSRNPRIKKHWQNRHQDVKEALFYMPRNVTVKQTLRAKSLIVTWEHGLSQQFLKHSLAEYSVVLHDEKCLSKSSDVLHLQVDAQLEYSLCGCVQKIISLDQNSIRFDDLEPSRRYFPMIARNENKSFYAVPPEPIVPRSYVTSSQTRSSAWRRGALVDVSSSRSYPELPGPIADPFSDSEAELRDENASISMDSESDNLEDTDESDWKYWEKEVFPSIFGMCIPEDFHDSTRDIRPLATFDCHRLGWRFEKDDYLSVIMDNPSAPGKTSRYIIRIHNIYPASNADAGKEGTLLVTQYSFLRKSPIFHWDKVVEHHPEFSEKELLLHFRDFDSMGNRQDAILLPVHKLVEAELVELDLQYTVEAPEDVSQSGLFCRFAVRSGKPGSAACIMPVASHLLPHSKRWPTPRYSYISPPKVLDLSPSIVGVIEGFRQSGCEIHAGIGFDPASDLTWKAAYQSAAVFDGLLHDIISDIELQKLNAPAQIPQDIPSIAVLCISDKSSGKREEHRSQDVKVLESMRRILGLQPKLDFLILAFPPWVFKENVYPQLFHAIYSLLDNRYCVHLKIVRLASYGVARDETMVILLASSVCTPIPWIEVFDQGTEMEIPAIDRMQDLSFNNPRVTRDRPSAFVCKHPVTNVDVYNHQTGKPVKGSQVPALGSTIDMKHAYKVKHPQRNDMLTVRELARIQGFNDDFVFMGAIEKQYEEVTQAFPPLVARKLADTILAIIGDFRSNVGSEDADGIPIRALSTLVGLIGPVFAFGGGDAAVHMVEETVNAPVTVPRALMISVAVNGALGFAMVLALFCAGELEKLSIILLDSLL